MLTHSLTHLLAGRIDSEVERDSGEGAKEVLKTLAVGDFTGKSGVKEVLSTAADGASIKGGSVQSNQQDQVFSLTH